MSPILPNSRTDLPADQPKHPFLVRAEQHRVQTLEWRAAQSVELLSAESAQAAKAKADAKTESPGRAKARGAAGGRLPQGIYRGTTPGTFRADAGRDPATGKRRRKDGFATVDEAVIWRERSLAADSGADLAVIDFTAKLPLAFGRALWDVKTRLAAKQAEAERKAVKPAQSGALPAHVSGATGLAGEAVTAAKPDLPLAQFEFTPELLVEMAAFWIERHPKGQAGITFARAAELWLASKEQKKVRPRTYGDCEHRISFWVRALGARRCADITTADLEAALSKRREELKAVTLRNYIAKVSALFTWLQNMGELAAGESNNPALAVVRPMIDEDVPDPFTVDEASALLSMALQTQAELGCLSYVAVGLFAGARFTELTRLKWGQHIAIEEELRRYRLSTSPR